MTGSLAGFEQLAGYHPTAEEAKILLAKTAIPNQYSTDKPHKNGVGLLNAYKLGRVGKDLKLLCGKNISCFKEMIRNDAIYTFPEDHDLLKTVEQAFPECGSQCGEGAGSSSCIDKAEVFKKLRKSAFLNPSNRVLWRYLACIYKRSDFPENSKAMLSIYRSLLQSPKGNLAEVCRSDADCVLVPHCNMKIEDHWDSRDSTSKLPEILPVPGLRNMSNTPEDHWKSRDSTSKLPEILPVPGGEAFLTRNPFLPMTRSGAEIYYIRNCKGNELCNNKCRCGNKEIVKGSNFSSDYNSKCVNSRCVMMRTSGLPPPPPLKKIPKKGSSPGGQR